MEAMVVLMGMLTVSVRRQLNIEVSYESFIWLLKYTHGYHTKHDFVVNSYFNPYFYHRRDTASDQSCFDQ